MGKRHLDLAIRQEAEGSVRVRWHQFMLYPEFDRAGHDFLAFFRSKYGEALQVPMWDAIRAVAKPVGINFAFERMTRGPASIDGHRLVRWAERQRAGIAPALIEDLASSFFEQAEVIDMAFLVSLAERHGFDGAAAAQYLASGADMREPFAETEAWRANGVTGMPHFILRFANGNTEIVRKTSIAVFADAFRRDRELARQIAETAA